MRRHNRGNPELTAYLKTLSFERLVEFCDSARAHHDSATIDVRHSAEAEVA